MKNKLFQKNKGLTLIEIMLSLAIMGIIALFSVPVYQSFIAKNDIEIASQTISSTIRHAQISSMGMIGNSGWGIKIESGQIIMFRGASYASREVSYDEFFSLPATITPSGISEIVFEKVTGFPSQTGSIIITSTNSDTRILILNSKGVIVSRVNGMLSDGDWLALNVASLVPSSDTQNGEKIQVSGNYAYIIRSGPSPDLLVYDISNPSSPTLAGTLAFPANPVNLFISGSYAYVVFSYPNAEFQIINISTPSSPSFVTNGFVNLPNTDYANDVYVVGTKAYVTRADSSGADNFFIIDVSDPSAPAVLSSLYFSGSCYEVVVSGNYAYIGSASDANELRVVDVSEPSNPFQAYSIDFPGGSDSPAVAMEGSNLIISNSGLIRLIDISNPLSPVIKSLYNTGANQIFDISLSSAHGSNGHIYAFIATDIAPKEFFVLDITNPSSPTTASFFGITPTDILTGVAYSSLLDKVFASTMSSNEMIVFGSN